MIDKVGTYIVRRFKSRHFRRQCENTVYIPGAYAGFLRGGGGANFKFCLILYIHAAKRNVVSSEAASLC